ncbi:hypothetical protein BDN70DRAFT_940058, partial [Pholiota conissans]
GISGAQIEPYASEDLAQAAYETALAEGRVRRVTVLSSRERLDITYKRPPIVYVPTHDGEPHRWYSITVGRTPGVFYGSFQVTANTIGIKGGVPPAKFYSESEAIAHFEDALSSGRVVRAVEEVTSVVL